MINIETTVNGVEVDRSRKILEENLAKVYVQLEALDGKLDDQIEELDRQQKINSLLENVSKGVGATLVKEVMKNDTNSIGIMTDQGAGNKENC